MFVRYGTTRGFDPSDTAAGRKLAARFYREGDGGASTGDGGGEGGGSPGETKTDENKTFTQAELDDIVKERIRRAKPADYDDLKAKATQFDEWEEKNKDATTKAIDDAKKATRAEVEAEFQEARFGDRILVQAAKDFADPEDAVLRLKGRYKDFLKSDGSIDSGAIDSELKALLKDKPHLAAPSGDGKTKPGSVDGGARKTTTGSEDLTPKQRMRNSYSK